MDGTRTERVRALLRCAAAATVAFVAARATADLEVELILGGRVEGRIDPADEFETFHLDLPAGAVLKVAATGATKRDRPVSLVLYDPDGGELATGMLSGSAVKVPKLTVTESGRYDVEVAGDGTATTSYRLSFSWKTPRGGKYPVTLDVAGSALPFVADAGARATFEVKASKSSGAIPRLVEMSHDETGQVVGFKTPAPGSKLHRLKKVAIPQTGDWTLRVANDGASGPVTILVAVTQPPAAKKALAIPTLPEPTPGVPDLERGLVGASGGTVAGSGAVAGATVTVPPKAVDQAFGLEVGASEDIVPPTFDLAPAGPAVFFGPAGTQFEKDVTIRLPFDAALFPAGDEELEIVRSDGPGHSEIVPRDEVTVDLAAGIASFPVDHFTSFQVFQRPPVVRLVPPDGEPGDEFGLVVDLDGDTLVAGAPSTDDAGTNSGSAYVFVRSGATWTSQGELRHPSGASGDFFGSAVAVDGDTAVVGAPFDDDDGDQSGSVHVFVRSGTTWTHQQSLAAPNAEASDLFGESVALRGDRIVVGAPGDSDAGTGAGRAHVWLRVGGSWGFEDSLDGSDVATGDRFGEHVAIDGDLVAVSAQRRNVPSRVRGKAYVFARAGSDWTEERIVGAPAGDANAEGFATHLDLDGTTLVVGAYADAQSGADSGAAFVFTRDTGTWPLQQKLLPASPATGIAMGVRVAISGETVAAAAPGGGPDGTGSIVVFTRSGTTWTRTRTIVPTGADAEDVLGLSLALSGQRIAAGFAGIDDLGTNAGFVYVYDAVGR